MPPLLLVFIFQGWTLQTPLTANRCNLAYSTGEVNKNPFILVKKRRLAFFPPPRISRVLTSGALAAGVLGLHLLDVTEG
jgi:hypothetical protein